MGAGRGMRVGGRHENGRVERGGGDWAGRAVETAALWRFTCSSFAQVQQPLRSRPSKRRPAAPQPKPTGLYYVLSCFLSFLPLLTC